MNFTYVANWGGIGPKEHEFLNDEDLPIFSARYKLIYKHLALML